MMDQTPRPFSLQEVDATKVIEKLEAKIVALTKELAIREVQIDMLLNEGKAV